MSALKESMDRANPNTLSDGFRVVQIGKTLASDVKQTKRKVNFDDLGVSASELATLDALVLPEDARAGTVLRAYGRTGTAGTGEMTVAAPNATPATGEIAVSPSGNIVALAADVLTDVDVEYIPVRGDVFEFTGPVSSGSMALPSSITDRGVILLLSAQAQAPSVADQIVVAPGATPITGQAALSEAKDSVEFLAGDGHTEATVRLLVVASVDANAELEADSPHV